MIQIDEHIFQMGWFNHQPGMGVFLMNTFVNLLVQAVFFLIVNGYLVRMIVCYTLLWPDILVFMSSFLAVCVFGQMTL